MDEVSALVDVDDPPRWFVLDAVAIDDIDYTGGQALAEFADDLAARNITFAVSNANRHVRQILDRFGVTEKIGTNPYYDSNKAARNAFHAA